MHFGSLARLARASSSQAAVRAVLRGQLDAIKEAGTYKSERVISSPQGASIRVEGGGGELLNFCANNYLGLSVGICVGECIVKVHSLSLSSSPLLQSHPEVIEAGREALHKYGAGLSSVRFICGTQVVT